jgi:hypothetical protein
MTPEETLIQRYFDAFNSHDIEGVMCRDHRHRFNFKEASARRSVKGPLAGLAG